MTDDELDRHLRDILTIVMGTFNAEAWLGVEYRIERGRDRLRLAVDAAVREERESSWLPIETAPKDGSYVLTWTLDPASREPCDNIDMMYFDDGYWWAAGRMSSPEIQPTYWMPLPEPPTAIRGGAS